MNKQIDRKKDRHTDKYKDRQIERERLCLCVCVKEKERVRKRQDRGKTGRIGRSHKLTKNTIITFAIF